MTFIASYDISYSLKSIIANWVVLSHLPGSLCRNGCDWSFLFFKKATCWLLSHKFTCSTSLLLLFQPALVVVHDLFLKCYIILYSRSSVLFLLSLNYSVKLMASVITSVQMTSKSSSPILTSFPNLSKIVTKTYTCKNMHRYPASNYTELAFRPDAFYLCKIPQICILLYLSSR